jgi:hypothetical protein
MNVTWEDLYYVVESDLKYPEITVTLVGEDGNAFNILGICRRAMKDAGCSKGEIEQFTQEATSGDYDNLLQTTMKYFEVE